MLLQLVLLCCVFDINLPTFKEAGCPTNSPSDLPEMFLNDLFIHILLLVNQIFIYISTFERVSI